jgi:hypothetical protein
MIITDASEVLQEIVPEQASICDQARSIQLCEVMRVEDVATIDEPKSKEQSLQMENFEQGSPNHATLEGPIVSLAGEVEAILRAGIGAGTRRPGARAGSGLVRVGQKKRQKHRSQNLNNDFATTATTNEGVNENAVRGVKEEKQVVQEKNPEIHPQQALALQRMQLMMKKNTKDIPSTSRTMHRRRRKKHARKKHGMNRTVATEVSVQSNTALGESSSVHLGSERTAETSETIFQPEERHHLVNKDLGGRKTGEKMHEQGEGNENTTSKNSTGPASRVRGCARVERRALNFSAAESEVLEVSEFFERLGSDDDIENV